MKCPIDDTVLQMSERQGIEIDYCPQCRGVWLDRGELDKIIDRADVPPQRTQAPSGSPPAYEHREADPYRQESYGDRSHGQRRQHSGDHTKRRKESFLGELFDF
ncbi:MAG: hypothetical protein AVDCRST_MAG72-936 [uncultured Nocardioidaceae bacterium]|uniref:Transcription factor zinc-finger domain-containing protein n=1 Tax=uncultured Nocardioidaceae bacterium TaxID=253824 RepID=A0A6J4LVV8_9ACTN|nr:MAG: hypothetical protein AVDCRST_MAG72-936 [uncultured Nocardioidaceae bacterium]